MGTLQIKGRRHGIKIGVEQIGVSVERDLR
jgi:hypothetical protein